MNQNQTIIDQLLESHHDLLGTVTDHPDKFELKIIYTKIDRDSVNRPHLTTYEYDRNPGRYFYPASSVKLYAAVLALQKLKELGIKDLGKFTTLTIDSAISGQPEVSVDSTSKNGKPSIAQYIKKIFLVSDNDAFNRLYDFLGQSYFNRQLWERGLKKTRIFHRLSVDLTTEENRHTNPVSFWSDDKLIYHQNALYNSDTLTIDATGTQKGRGYIEDGMLVKAPKDFSHKNYSPLTELQGALQRIVFPEIFPKAEQFDLEAGDYQFLLKYMSMLPRESQYPAYSDTSRYYDSYVKFLLFGDSKEPIPQNTRIFNKVGDAYGYLIDNAYIVDFKNKIEFFLSAVIFVNENQIFNDDTYEYERIGFPFLANLGKIFYEYELKRARNYPPDLSRFVFNYSSPE